MKSITVIKVMFIAFLLAGVAMSQTERKWWVYMTPQEGIELYNSPYFRDIKVFADTYISGYNPTINKISHTEPWINELDKALEHTAAVYFALKHGKYKGGTNAEMQPYIDFSAKWWLFLTQKGNLSTWVKNQQYSSPDWYEGDITLRYWLLGAFPSYDAVRYDLPASTRTAVDAWLSGFAKVLWDDEEQLYESRFVNRGTASFGQALLIRLILQDKAGVDAYWDVQAYGSGKKPRGYKNIVDIFGYTRNPSCTSIPDLFGISDELRRRDGIHGIIVLAHAFNTMINFTHASRNGGSSDWDILSPTNQNQTNLKKLVESWYRFAFGDLYDAFNTYARCVESNSGQEAFWDPLKYGLKQKAGYSLAFIDERFETANWAKGDPATNNLWKLRSRMIRNTAPGAGSDSTGTHPGTDDSCGTPVYWNNCRIDPQFTNNEFTFKVKPMANYMDAVIGLSCNSAAAYTDLACSIQLNADGTFKVRNGAEYKAITSVPYQRDITYSCRMAINPSSHTYDVYITPSGSTESKIASSYAFRTEQASAGQLNYIVINSERCALSITDIKGSFSTSARYSPVYSPKAIRTHEESIHYFSISGKRINAHSARSGGVYLMSDKKIGTCVKRSIVNSLDSHPKFAKD